MTVFSTYPHTHTHPQRHLFKHHTCVRECVCVASACVCVWHAQIVCTHRTQISAEERKTHKKQHNCTHQTEEQRAAAEQQRPVEAATSSSASVPPAPSAGRIVANTISNMSGRPRTTSFAEGNKQPPNPVLGGVKISSKCGIPPPFSRKTRVSCVDYAVTHSHKRTCVRVFFFTLGSVFSPHTHTQHYLNVHLWVCVLRCSRITQLMFFWLMPFTGTPMFVFWVGETGPRRRLCASERVQRSEGVRTVVVGNIVPITGVYLWGLERGALTPLTQHTHAHIMRVCVWGFHGRQDGDLDFSCIASQS